MSIYAVVPLKQLSEGKRRLSGALSPLQRAELICAMADHVLATLSVVDEIAGVMVVTNDATLVPAHCVQIHDPGPDLNAAVVHAGRMVASIGGTSMLVVAADLPFITAEDIRCLITTGRQHAAVFAADSKGVGTNAILMSPPALLQSSFGEDSLAAHLGTARHAGISACVVRRAGVALDIDEPGDLQRLVRSGESGYSFLHPPLTRRAG